MPAPDLCLVIPPSLGTIVSHHEATSGMGALTAGPHVFLYAPHTAALCAAAVQQAGQRAAVLDAVGAGLNPHAASAWIVEQSPAIVAVLVSHGTRLPDEHFLRRLRDAGCERPVLLFGPSAAFVAEPLLAEELADAALIGEPEAALAGAVSAVMAGRRGMLPARDIAPARYDDSNLILDLDALPMPQWSLVDWRPYGAASLLSSRGCPAGCAWCAYVLPQGRRFRAQSAERTVEELAWTCETTGNARIQVRDPVFAHDPARVAAICEGILARGLKLRFACESRPEHLTDELLSLLAAAGCSTVKIGFESGDRALLQRLGRIAPEDADRYVSDAVRVARTCDRLGMACQVFVMAGLPGQDGGSLEMTRRVLRRLPRRTTVRAKTYEAHPGVDLEVQGLRATPQALRRLEDVVRPPAWHWRERVAAAVHRIRPAAQPLATSASPSPGAQVLPVVAPLRGQRVFLTGGNGFLGGYVARALVDAGASVVALVRPDSDPGVLGELDAEILRGDLCQSGGWQSALGGCTSCFHLAALYSTSGGPDALYDVNVRGTDRLLAACASHGVRRVVHTSTIGTVGRPADPRLLPDEDTPFGGWEQSTAYVRSKLLGELVALSWQGAGPEVVVVKPTAPVGAGDARPSATGRRILAALRGEAIPYPAGGINFAPARDIAAGMLSAAERGRAGRTYILGHREGNLDREAFLGLVTASAGMAPVRPRPSSKGSSWPSALTASPERAVSELGMPQTDLRTAFEESVAWYRNEGYEFTP